MIDMGSTIPGNGALKTSSFRCFVVLLVMVIYIPLETLGHKKLLKLPAHYQKVSS